MRPFRTVPQRLDDMPPAEVIADLFRDLDEAEREARHVRAQLDQLRQRHMLRERCWGLDLSAFRREIERKAA